MEYLCRFLADPLLDMKSKYTEKCNPHSEQRRRDPCSCDCARFDWTVLLSCCGWWGRRPTSQCGKTGLSIITYYVHPSQPRALLRVDRCNLRFQFCWEVWVHAFQVQCVSALLGKLEQMLAAGSTGAYTIAINACVHAELAPHAVFASGQVAFRTAFSLTYHRLVRRAP